MRRAALALALALGCGGVRSGPDEVVVAINTPARNLDPRFMAVAQDSLVDPLVAPALTRFDTPDGMPALMLAESIEREAPGRYLITLRPGLRFSDGREVTADDVAYTYQSALDPALHSTRRVRLESAGFRSDGITVVDRRRVRFTLTRPSATFLFDLGMGIVSRRAALAAGLGGRFPGRTVVGAGPYRLVSATDERIELARNEYWQPPAPIARLLFRQIPDQNTTLLALVGGSVDLTHRVDALVVDRALQDPRLYARTVPSTFTVFLGFQCEHPIWRNPEARRAIAMAIDRQALVQAKYAGHAEAATSLLGSSTWAHSQTVRLPPYDPAAARAELERLGLTGRTIIIKTYRPNDRIARTLEGQLAAVGVKSELRVYDTATALLDARRGNFELTIMSGIISGEPDQLHQFFHSSSISGRTAAEGGWNLWRYRDAAVDADLEAARVLEDRDERKRIYARIEQRLADTLPVLPLVQPHLIAVMRRELHGYQPSPAGMYFPLAAASKQP